MELKLSYTYGSPAKSGGDVRKSILGLQDLVCSMPDNMSPKEAEERFVEHFFAPKVYGRKMFIAKGMTVVGKIHKHAHLNILLYGSCKVVTEFGSEVLVGPKMWTSEPGTKRAVYALSDLEWVTVHDNPTGGTDTDEIEKHVIADSFEEFDRLRLEAGEMK